MHCKETRPTTIYWLFDTRTDIPFYCGKTVHAAEFRLQQHLRAARKGVLQDSAIAIAAILAEGGAVRVSTMEVVPADADWVNCEKKWIRLIRQINPAAVNVTDGGNGTSGWAPDAAWCQGMSARTKAYWADPVTGPRHAERVRAALADPVVEKKRLAALSEARLHPDYRANVRAAQQERWASQEARDEASAKYKIVWADPVLRENASAVSNAHWSDPANRVLQSERMIAIQATPEMKEKLSEAQKTRRSDPADREKTSRGMKAYWARRKAAEAAACV